MKSAAANAHENSDSNSKVGFSESDSHHLVRFEMPAFLGDEVTVRVSDDELVVKGHDRPRGIGSAREVLVRLETNQTGVFARYKNGVLVVGIPKRVKTRTPLALVRN